MRHARHPSCDAKRMIWTKLMSSAHERACGPFPAMRSYDRAMSALVFFCHGSRDPDWRVPFERLAAEQRRLAPLAAVELAFLELMEPDLPTVIDRLAGRGQRRIRIVPLFLAAGRHTRQDLPALVVAAQQRWPGLQLSVDAALLDQPAVRTAILEVLSGP